MINSNPYYGATLVAQDEDGFPIRDSCMHLYLYSPTQGCYIPKRPELLIEFKDNLGKLVSLRYAKAHGYWYRHEYFTSKAAHKIYMAERTDKRKEYFQ